MLHKLAFATSLAVLTAVLYLFLSLLAVVAPAIFQLVFNAQFFGADVASLLPRTAGSRGSLATFVLVVGTAWVFGYAWAWLYNRLAATF